MSWETDFLLQWVKRASFTSADEFLGAAGERSTAKTRKLYDAIFSRSRRADVVIWPVSSSTVNAPCASWLRKYRTFPLKPSSASVADTCKRIKGRKFVNTIFLKIGHLAIFSISTCLKNSRTFFSIFWYLYWVAISYKDGAVVIDIQHFHLHCYSGAESRAASVCDHHFQVVLCLSLSVKLSQGGQGSCAGMELEISFRVSS